MTFNTFLASWHNLPFNLLTFSNWYVQLGVSLNPCDIIQDLPTTERSACCINFPVFRVGKALFEIPIVHVRAAPLMRFWNSSFFLSPVVWSSKFQRHHPCMGKKVHSTGKKSFFWASLMQNRLKVPNMILVFGFGGPLPCKLLELPNSESGNLGQMMHTGHRDAAMVASAVAVGRVV